MKAQYKVVGLNQFDVMVLDGKEYVYRGLSKDGTVIKATVKGKSSEWVSFPVSEFEVEVIKVEAPAKKPSKAPAKPVVKATTHRGYKKQRATEAESEVILSQSEKCVCSYKMNGIHLRIQEDGTLLQHGGFTAMGKARADKIYTDPVVSHSGSAFVVDCTNSSGDLVRFIHDGEETYLFVLKMSSQSADLC